MAMTYYSYPRSHLQLIVPMQYYYGGYPYKEDNVTIWDGDGDTIQAASGSSTDNRWDFASAQSSPAWFYLWGHSGGQTGGNYTILGDATTLNSLTQWEEKRGQSTRDWDLFTTKHQRHGTDSIYSNLLLEIDNSGAPTATWSSLIWKINSVTGASTMAVKGCVFSQDFKVPLYRKTWQCEHSFLNINGTPNFTGVDLSNFALAKSLRLTSRHSFEWGGLTSSDMTIWKNFFAAFGGSVSQPFFMVVINGDLANGFGTMESRCLVIDQHSIRDSLQRNGEYTMAFSALELSYTT